MAIESGIGMTCAIDNSAGTARTLDGHVTNLSFDTPQNLQDITGIDKSGNERLGLLRDFTCSTTCTFDDAGTVSFDVFNITTGTRTITLVLSGQTLANETLLGSVSWPRNADGSFMINGSFSLQSGTVPTWS